MHHLSIKIIDSGTHEGFSVLVTAYRKDQVVLASVSLGLVGTGVTELLPSLLANVATGWLYGGPEEAVTLPAAAFRSQRRNITLASRWGTSPEAGGGSQQ